MSSDRRPKMHKPEEFRRFGYFVALPIEERRTVFGFTTEKQFASHFKLRPATLSEWKQREDFWATRDKHLLTFKKHTSAVIEALAKRAIRTGEAYHVLAFLRIVEGLNEKDGTGLISGHVPARFKIVVHHEVKPDATAK